MLYLKQLSLVGLLASASVDAHDLRNLLAPSTSTQYSKPISTDPAAVPSRRDTNIGVWTPTALEEMIKERNEYASQGRLSELQKRDQYIIALCPEEWHGGSPKACSNCGGDTIVSGQCNQILLTGSQSRCTFPGGCGVYCRRISDGVDNTPGKVTSVATRVVDTSAN